MVCLGGIEQFVQQVDWAFRSGVIFICLVSSGATLRRLGSAAVLSNKRSSAALASLRLVSVDLWNAAFAGRKKSQSLRSLSTGGSARSSAQTPTRSGKKCLHSLQQCRSVKHSGQLLWRLMGRGISAGSRPQFQQTTVLMNSTAANIGPLRPSWRCAMKACLQRMR